MSSAGITGGFILLPMIKPTTAKTKPQSVRFHSKYAFKENGSDLKRYGTTQTTRESITFNLYFHLQLLQLGRDSYHVTMVTQMEAGVD
jgi:hypothetical protein